MTTSISGTSRFTMKQLCGSVWAFPGGAGDAEQLCLQGVQSDEAARTLGMVLLRMRNKNPPVPGSVDAKLWRGSVTRAVWLGRKSSTKARKELSLVVSQYPQYPNIHYAFGIILLEASDLSAADGEFKEEIKNNPADIVSRLQIAAAMYKTDSAEGVPYAEQAVKLAPQQPFAHYLLGMLLLISMTIKEPPPELEIAQKAFPANPEFISRWYRLFPRWTKTRRGPGSRCICAFD